MENEMKRVIDINLDLTNSSLLGNEPVKTSRIFYTTDIGTSHLRFTSKNEISNSIASIVLKNLTDGSKIQRNIEVTDKTFSYILGEEIEHAGDWIGQVVIEKDNKFSTSRSFKFQITGGLLGVPSLSDVDDYKKLYKQLNSLNDDMATYLETALLSEEQRVEAEKIRNSLFEEFETNEAIRLESETKRLESEAIRVEAETKRVDSFEKFEASEETRKNNEINREENYELKIDSAIIESKIDTKVNNKVVELTPAIQNVTAQLAQTEQRVSETIANAGNGTTPTELVDMRVVNGKTYTVAGDALRALSDGKALKKESITPRKTSFITDYNILIPENSLRGGFWQTNGGTWQVRANLNQSEKIAYTTGDTIYFSRLSGALGNSVVQFWDLDTQGNPTIYLGYSSRTLQINISTVSPNCKAFSFAYYDGEEYDLKVYVNQVRQPALKGIDISESMANSIVSPWKEKKVIYQGDSVTDIVYNGALSTHWTTYLNAQLGLIQTANYAMSGSTLAVNPTDPTSRNPIVNRLDAMSANADVVFNAGITNDWFYSWSPIGNMENREATTLYGALHLICLNYKKKYKNATIIFTTAIKRYQGTSINPLSKNSLGLTLSDYNNIMKEVCRYYSIRVLDMDVESGLFPFDNALAIQDYNDQGYFTHPNANGQLKMGKVAVGYFSGIKP